MFQRIVHADWSIAAAKRWAVWACRDRDRWRVSHPTPVTETATFVAELLAAAKQGPVLAGFDFPIGVPLGYGLQTGLKGFRDALARFGSAPGWQDFYDVAASAADIALERPFFPRVARRGMRRDMLADKLGLGTHADLLRLCERAGPGLRQACPVFWTLGANQVGRAALSGWREVIVPALGAGAALWPFDGALDRLAHRGGLVLAETYPADAYARVGAPFGRRASKRRQRDRQAGASAIRSWAQASRVDLTECAASLADGFGARAAGEDAFDALLGALGMIAVADGSRPAMPADIAAEQIAWEGWILGRASV